MRTLFHRYFEAFFLPPETKEEYHRIHSNWCLPPQNAAELEQLREHNRTESKNKCPVSVQMLDYQKHVHFLYQNRLKAFSCITRGNDFRNFFSLNYYYPSIHFYLSPTVNYHHIRNLQKFIFFNWKLCPILPNQTKRDFLPGVSPQTASGRPGNGMPLRTRLLSQAQEPREASMPIRHEARGQEKDREGWWDNKLKCSDFT